MAVIEGTGEVVIERQPEILDKIIKRQKELIDPDFNNRNDEVIGELNQIVSQIVSELNEFIEAVRDCWDIDRAEGFALDNLLSLKKVRREEESKSYTNKQRFVGSNGAVVPSGRVIYNIYNGDEFRTIGTTNLTSRACFLCNLQVPNVTEGEVYSISVSGFYFEYTAQAGDTVSDVMSGLYFASDSVLFGTDYQTFLYQEGQESFLRVFTTEDSTIVDVLPSSNIVVTTVEVYGYVESVETGPIPIPNYSLRDFAIPVQGVVETYNVGEGVMGRARETDEELRSRGKRESLVDGVGTVPAIEGSLVTRVDGVGSAIVIENDTGAVDSEGRPAKSFETIVVGGTNESVAKELFRTKPAAMETYGTISEIVLDQNGQNRLVKFTRPASLPVDVRVTYSIYDEEIFPVTGPTAIVEVVVDYINSLGLNADIIPTRLYGPIYSAASGIDSLLVEIDAGGGYTTNRIPVSISEYVTTTENDVTLVVV